MHSTVTDRPHLPPPEVPTTPRLEIKNERETTTVLTGEDLEALGPEDHEADFHCVTTWSKTGLVWRGVKLRDVFASIGITDADAGVLAVSG